MASRMVASTDALPARTATSTLTPWEDSVVASLPARSLPPDGIRTGTSGPTRPWRTSVVALASRIWPSEPTTRRSAPRSSVEFPVPARPLRLARASWIFTVSVVEGRMRP